MALVGYKQGSSKCSGFENDAITRNSLGFFRGFWKRPQMHELYGTISEIIFPILHIFQLKH